MNHASKNHDKFVLKKCELNHHVTAIFLLLTFFSYFFTPPPDFISHSASLQQLKFIFQQALPDLRDKTLVDVGSRLGVVLYGVSADI